MSKQIKLKIITPEKLIFDELVDQVSLPTVNGEITILSDHIPLIVDLSAGDIVAVKNNEDIPFVVVGGFVEIKNDENQDNNKITEVAVLADFAETVLDLSDDIIAEAKARAEKLKTEMDSKELVDFERLETELARSLTRIKIADKWRIKKYRK